MSVDEILEELPALTVEERARVKALLDTLPSNSEPLPSVHGRESAWIKRHRDEYMNQWVALDGDKLLAHGTDAREVYLAARATGVYAPFLEQITPKPEGAFMGGWQ